MVTFSRQAKSRRTKYNARHVSCDLGGKTHTHDSVAERNRHHVLHLKQELEEIYDLRVHQRYKLEVNGILITTYEDDFSYQRPDGPPYLVVEDVKGVRTREYLIKKALMKALYGIEIQEVP